VRNEGQRSNSALKGDTVRDPVCGMYMDPRLALRIDMKGKARFSFSSDKVQGKVPGGQAALNLPPGI